MSQHQKVGSAKECRIITTESTRQRQYGKRTPAHEVSSQEGLLGVGQNWYFEGAKSAAVIPIVVCPARIGSADKYTKRSWYKLQNEGRSLRAYKTEKYEWAGPE